MYKDYYPPVMGGVERTIHLMAQGTRDEFDVRVLVNSGTLRTFTEGLDGVRVTRVSEWGRLASAPVSPAFIGALRREAADADILHFHHPNPTGDVACLLTRPTAPIVMTYHSDVVRQRAAMVVYGPIQERMMRACRVIMPTSPDYVESSEWLQRHRDRCRVLPLGIDVGRFQSTPAVEQRAAEIRSAHPGPLIAFVGRLRYYKGLHFLIEAMKAVEATLLAVGGGSDLP
ncbi:MAG: glycosyltransferase, partial [Gemmatimonadetes bacterium]|nr:glycosyltransferase [Gemmatimonadota bacterium]